MFHFCTTKSEELRKKNDPMNVVDADLMTDAVKVIESPSVLSCDVCGWCKRCICSFFAVDHSLQLRHMSTVIIILLGDVLIKTGNIAKYHRTV